MTLIAELYCAYTYRPYVRNVCCYDVKIFDILLNRCRRLTALDWNTILYLGVVGYTHWCVESRM